MNKELFVSSTPHETKVGLVEDDLLAEVYLERENEYTLAGSIYKGRVTRVLPGMQSAFVDIGLERDAFLYVSDFMELEEHDDDLTDVVPANRNVQDLRPQPARAEATECRSKRSETEHAADTDLQPESEEGTRSKAEDQNDAQPAQSAGSIRRANAAIRRAANAEATAAAAAVVADAAMAEMKSAVTAAAMAGIVDRNEVRIGARNEPQIELPIEVRIADRSHAMLVPPMFLPRAHSIPAEASPRARRPDTSQSCCRESRFPSTSAMRSTRLHSKRQLGKRSQKAQLQLRRILSASSRDIPRG